MKTNLKIIVAAVVLLLAGCDKKGNEPEPEPQKPTLAVTPAPDPIAFSARATESYVFTVTTNQPSWEAETDQSWCTLTVDNEANTLTVNASRNESTTAPAPATITLSAGDAPALTILATQAAVEYDIHIAGYYITEGRRKVACYWKNGVRTDLPLPAGEAYSDCTGIIHSNGSIYMSGNYSKDNSKACYWKDGVFFDASALDQALSIAVDGNSVYLAGSKSYWKDGSTEAYNAWVFEGKSIVVSNGTVSVAGRAKISIGVGADLAYIWSKGHAVPLEYPTPDMNNSYASSAVADGGAVYVGGRYRDATDYVRACYWKDGVCMPLPLGPGKILSSVSSLFVADGKVYAAGFDEGVSNSSSACSWVDGKYMPLELPDPDEVYLSYGIAAAGGSVYVAGIRFTNDGRHVCYWKDGKIVDIIDPDADKIFEIVVSGIVVVEK